MTITSVSVGVQVWRSARVQLACLVILSAACREAPSPPALLAAAPEPFRSLTHAPLIDLPATGGFVVNDYPVARDSMAAMFRAIRSWRAEERAAFFGSVDSSRLRDVAWVDSLGRAMGVGVYSARATWPNYGPPPGVRVIRPDSSL